MKILDVLEETFDPQDDPTMQALYTKRAELHAAAKKGARAGTNIDDLLSKLDDINDEIDSIESGVKENYDVLERASASFHIKTNAVLSPRDQKRVKPNTIYRVIAVDGDFYEIDTGGWPYLLRKNYAKITPPAEA